MEIYNLFFHKIIKSFASQLKNPHLKVETIQWRRRGKEVGYPRAQFSYYGTEIVSFIYECEVHPLDRLLKSKISNQILKNNCFCFFCVTSLKNYFISLFYIKLYNISPYFEKFFQKHSISQYFFALGKNYG